MSNPLNELARAGQSVWYDQMTRSLLTEGHLARMIADDSLGGLTSNPTIFEKAIGGSGEYDEELGRLAARGLSRDEIYDRIALHDIGGAADLFRDRYDESDGEHGYVSFEVDPRLAHDTEGTIEEARRHHEELNRPNVMIKVPATPEGMPAIEQLISEGINVNVTLIFSREVYDQVIEAYLRGLERRAEAGESLDRVASVASFFVSRIDTKADELIGKRIQSASEQERVELESCLGAVAIGNAKLAYQLFLERFESERFERLRAAGARVQRPLWASTGTKNPAYSDVLYVDNLIGPDTVNTLPPVTYDAFRDHGRVERTIDRNLEEANRVLETIERYGISLKEITDQLTTEGVESFAKSFESLMTTLDERRREKEGTRSV
jgi:transaldolase / glucose-6-phosphate isomerase